MPAPRCRQYFVLQFGIKNHQPAAQWRQRQAWLPSIHSKPRTAVLQRATTMLVSVRHTAVQDESAPVALRYTMQARQDQVSHGAQPHTVASAVQQRMHGSSRSTATCLMIAQTQRTCGCQAAFRYSNAVTLRPGTEADASA